MATNPQQIVDQLLTLSADPENQAYIVRESGTFCYATKIAYRTRSAVPLWQIVRAQRLVVAQAAFQVWWATCRTPTTMSCSPPPKPFGTSALDQATGTLSRTTQDCLRSWYVGRACAHPRENTPPSHRWRSLVQRELKASPDSRVSEIVAKTIDNLSPAVKPLIISSAPTSENTFPAGAAPVSKAKPARARPIKMKVEGISQEYWRGMVEKALIRVPGVVSVTLDKVRGARTRAWSWRILTGCRSHCSAAKKQSCTRNSAMACSTALFVP